MRRATLPARASISVEMEGVGNGAVEGAGSAAGVGASRACVFVCADGCDAAGLSPVSTDAGSLDFACRLVGRLARALGAAARAGGLRPPRDPDLPRPPLEAG